MNLHAFYSVFKSPKSGQLSQTDKDAMVVGIVSRLSRGSALLQRGLFSTRSDIDTRIENLSKHDFLAK